MIPNEYVVWVDNPEARRILCIRVEKTPDYLVAYDQVIQDQVLSFRSIFDEDDMPHDVPVHVILHSEVANPMNSRTSVI